METAEKFRDYGMDLCDPHVIDSLHDLTKMIVISGLIRATIVLGIALNLRVLNLGRFAS